MGHHDSTVRAGGLGQARLNRYSDIATAVRLLAPEYLQVLIAEWPSGVNGTKWGLEGMALNFDKWSWQNCLDFGNLDFSLVPRCR